MTAPARVVAANPSTGDGPRVAPVIPLRPAAPVPPTPDPTPPAAPALVAGLAARMVTGVPLTPSVALTRGPARDLPVLAALQLLGAGAAYAAGEHLGPVGLGTAAVAWATVAIGYAMRGGPR